MTNTAEVYDSAATAAMTQLLGWHLLNTAYYNAEHSSMVRKNSVRHTSAQQAVAGMYACIGIMMLELVILGTVWMNWLWQPLKSNETVPEGHDFNTGYRQNIAMWWFIFTAVLIIVSAAGGFMAWVITGIILFFFIFTMNFIVYPIVRNKCPDCCYKTGCLPCEQIHPDEEEALSEVHISP